MSRMIGRRHAARQDLVDIAYYYISQGTPATALRFRKKAEAAFQQLAEMPGLGTHYDHDHPALAEIRVSVLSRPFNAYLIFYRPMSAGIEIVRVLHGARDIAGILAEEFGIENDADGDQAEEENE
ncbi:MAG: type II toxin-antitoxin system RelE/ParE family toxin [Isosphaeraceae bacterium]|nr:type II toxin-antitoxin system RelE/ParE family toxin [Isosphaeraceae bacterium]